MKNETIFILRLIGLAFIIVGWFLLCFSFLEL